MTQSERFRYRVRNMTLFGEQGEPDPSWKMFQTRDEARTAAELVLKGQVKNQEWHQALEWIRYSIGDKAWRETNHAVAEAWKYIQLNPEWCIDIERDARLMARCIRIADMPEIMNLPALEPHVNHARARWGVWEAQYGLAGDVHGVLYVYRERPTPRVS